MLCCWIGTLKKVDVDGDGIPNDDDSCVTEPETVNGFQDGDGCPDEAPPDIGDITEGLPIDTDGDTVEDEFDLCPFQSGTVENIGCPEPVIMQDGIGTTEIPPPLFDPSTIPPPSEFMTQIFAQDTSEEDTRNFVILILIIGGLGAVGVAGAISRMRRR